MHTCTKRLMSFPTLLTVCCRLVEGDDLYKHLLLNDIHNAADKEKQVLKVAAELLDVSCF